MSIAFDTHRFVKRLTTEGGFTEQQAEILADEQVAMLNANLATKADIEAIKADIEALRHETKTEIAKVESGLKAQIEALRHETKTEIAKVEAGLKAEIAKVEAGLKAEIAKVDKRIESVRADLLKWMFAGLIAQGGVVVALLQLFK